MIFVLVYVCIFILVNAIFVSFTVRYRRRQTAQMVQAHRLGGRLHEEATGMH